MRYQIKIMTAIFDDKPLLHEQYRTVFYTF